jgi:hypothetical protein
MARQPRSAKTENKSKLLDALQFCSVVSEKVGAPFETHIGLRNKWAVAFNGIVAAGAPIDEDIVVHSHNLLLIEALSKCEESYSLTQLANGRLSIRSGKFKAEVPCLDPALMQEASPDPFIVGIDNKFRDAVEAVGVLASENAQHVLTASVLMNGASVISTNRVMIMEHWHGLDLPPNIPLPKEFVKALVSVKKNLTGFGFSNCSATFYFEDGCWLRTQLYAEAWPDVSRILELKANLWTIDANFFKALSAVAPFSENGQVYSDTNLLMSHAENNGASYEVAGLPKGFVYPIKQLLMLKPFVKTIDYMANGVHDSSYCLVAYGDSSRAIISGRAKP